MAGGRIEATYYFAANVAMTCTDTSGATVVTITAGTYTPTTLIAAIDAALDADWTISCSMTDLTGTGRVTIGSGLVNFTVTFADTSLRDALGFTGNIGSSSSAQTGTNAMKGLWIPDTHMFYRVGGANSAGTPISNARATVSALGHVKGLVGSVANVYDGIAWNGIGRDRAYATVAGTASSPVNNNFETLMRETQYGGVVSYFRPYSPIRLYWDSGASDYVAGTLQIPSTWEASHMIDGWTGRWNVALPRLWKTPA